MIEESWKAFSEEINIRIQESDILNKPFEDNKTAWELWEQAYQLIEMIPTDIYDNICTTITNKKIVNVINNSPLAKAPGPSLISMNTQTLASE
ncbi:27429_t:CDS:2 [Gigaspora margarita]|uniref:27429_t:CDS:1 n=1 Tax=Gigaspora margarita TaxID=4874 RepID=A0ABN7VLF4_GIGMA|nr:27429_t:CDS:2 [Gigaspora margarita]